MEKFDLPKRLQGSTPSVWNEYIALAMQYKPLNLGQGFPDDAAPSYVTNALAEIAKDTNPLLQQYTRGNVGDHSNLLDWSKEIIVFS